MNTTEGSVLDSVEENTISELLRKEFHGIYSQMELRELQESALLMDEWSKKYCFKMNSLFLLFCLITS